MKIATLLVLVLIAGNGSTASGSSCSATLKQAEGYSCSAQPESSIVVAKRVLDCAIREFGKNDSSVASIHLLVSRYQLMAERFEAADSSALSGVRILERIWGRGHPEVLKAQTKLAEVERYTGRAVEADSLLKYIICMVTIYDLDVLIKADAYTQLGIGHRFRNEFDSARFCFDKALSIYNSLPGDFQEQKLQIEISKGRILIWESRYADAEDLLEKLISNLSSKCARDSMVLAEAHYHLGQAHRMLAKYLDAEDDERTSIDIRKKIIGIHHYLTAEAYYALGMVYQDQGNYLEGKQYLELSLTIFRLTIGEGNWRVGGVLRNLARLYNEIGQFVEAESLYSAAVLNREQSLSAQHPGLAQVLIEVASFYVEHRKYAKAEEALHRTLVILERAFKRNHETFAFALDGLGRVCLAQGKHEESLAHFERARDICEEVFGQQSANYALCLQHIASVYLEQFRYNLAKPLYDRAVRIMNSALSEDHPLLASCLEAKSACEYLIGDLQMSLEDAERAYSLRRKSFAANCQILSETDALRFSDWMRNAADRSLTAFFGLEIRDSAAVRRMCNIILSTKGEVSDEMFDRRRLVEISSDPVVSKISLKLKQARRELAAAFVQDARTIRSANVSVNITGLSRFCDSLESELNLRCTDYHRLNDPVTLTSSSLCSLIPPNTVVIEYMRYNSINFQSDTRTPHYLAAIFRPPNHSAIIDLGNSAEIDSAVKLYRRHLHVAATVWPNMDDQEVRDTDQILRRLYQKIIHPLQHFVVHSDLLLISPDGALNFVSYATLKDGEGKFLIERKRIHYLSSARELRRLQEDPGVGEGLLALGDPNFGTMSVERSMSTDTLTLGASARTSSVIGGSSRSPCDSLRGLSVEPLPYTRREVLRLETLWKSLNLGPVEVFLGVDASEKTFKSRSPGKRAIHIASHGFSRLGYCDRQEMVAESSALTALQNPLLLSGFLLAGANSSRTRSTTSEDEDGFVTAEEVAAIKLDGIRLVVLSTCESGLGEIERGEGVYGLRRAFQIAGVRTVVSSLWQVPDKETQIMSEALYSTTGETLDLAMQRMALQQINDLRKRNMPDHPFPWGAFVAMGDWNSLR